MIIILILLLFLFVTLPLPTPTHYYPPTISIAITLLISTAILHLLTPLFITHTLPLSNFNIILLPSITLPSSHSLSLRILLPSPSPVHSLFPSFTPPPHVSLHPLMFHSTPSFFTPPPHLSLHPSSFTPPPPVVTPPVSKIQSVDPAADTPPGEGIEYTFISDGHRFQTEGATLT